MSRIIEKQLAIDYITKHSLSNTILNNNKRIILHASTGKAVEQKMALVPLLLTLEILTGQKCGLTQAKYSMAG